tara:strand:- start:27874 stop:30516 length:2643 start_codon:yes stop_codon:yes gene_type:complete
MKKTPYFCANEVFTGSEIFRVASILLYATLLFHVSLLIYTKSLALSALGLGALVFLILLLIYAIARNAWPNQIRPNQAALFVEMILATGCVVLLPLHDQMPTLPMPWLIAIAGAFPLALSLRTSAIAITLLTIIGYAISSHLGVAPGDRLPDVFATLCVGALSTVLSQTLAINRAAVQQARTNERRFTAIARVTRHAFVITDQSYEIQYANPALQEVIGYSPEEMIVHKIKPEVHPDDVLVHKEKLRFLRDTPHSTIFSCHRSRHKNGHWIWLETHGHNMMHDPSIDGLVFSLEDITLRKNAESQLYEETALLRAVLDHNPAMIYAKDTKGHFTISNLSFQKLFGYSNEEELRGKTAYELLSNAIEIASQEVANSVAKRIESQDRYIMDTGEPLLNLQGKGFFHHDIDRWYYTNKYPLRDAQGKMIGVLGITQDTTDRREYESRIEYQAMHDSLTGLPNRRLLVKHLAAAMQESRQQKSGLTLLFCDLDFFKSVNDTHGHDFGDKCLIETSKRILTVLSSQDFVARFGGNEFVILTNATLAQATVKADAIMQSVSQPLVFNDVVVKLEASIGIAQLNTEHRTPAELIQDADAAMYQAKERGRNRIEFYDAGLQSKSSREARMDVALRFALERNELSLTYQPKVSLADGNVTGFEVLLRWNSPEYGLISPTEFIPIAERSGLVVPIGMWALEQACRQLAEWHARYPSHATMSVAVNVSMRQLMHAPFLTEVRRILDETNILPQTLELELTETSAMANPLQTIENLTMLKKLGLSLALDDFGTGYSSLAYLQKLPLDVVKIDQTFVRGLGTNSSDMEIMRLIMVLAQTLKLRTVAEGVETQQHIDELKRMGCDMGQGFIFAAALTAEEAEKLIRTSHRFLAE